MEFLIGRQLQSNLLNLDVEKEIEQGLKELGIDLNEIIETDGYSYIQTHIYGNPNYNDCVKAIIREYLSAEEEFDLINSYNSYQANLLDDESIATNYLNYLNLLKQIKQNIKKDFK